MNPFNPIPGLDRNLDPSIPNQILEARVKIIDRRRAEIEAELATAKEKDYRTQELAAERAALGSMRNECMEILRPRPKPVRHPTLEAAYQEQRKLDLAFLRNAIKQENEHIEANARREEVSGNHRQARLHRLMLPSVPERMAREFGKDLSLLSELDEKPRVGGGVPRRMSA
jgi:hypothetical protein